ncbi:hypothetical protein SY88_17940 [Clostridiales bacterium PH28_bin88]|nr:hypothetical protein SY88_17940 [Clostridiales bacterium PH28_bin88]
MANDVTEMVMYCRYRASEAKRCWQGLEVPCLGSISPEVMVAIMAEGMESINFFYRPQACADCSVTGGEDVFLDNLARGRIWLRTVGIEEDRLKLLNDAGQAPKSGVSGRPSNKDHLVNESRREFFTSIFKGLRQVPATMVDEVLGPAHQPSGEKPVFQVGEVPEKRRVLLGALNKMEAEVLAQKPTPLLQVSVQDKCYFCGACARLCPTGALEMDSKEEGTAELCIHDAWCTGCGLCADVCFERALVLEKGLPLAYLLSLERRLLDSGLAKTCPECGDLFTGNAHAGMCMRCTMLGGRVEMMREN